MVRYNDQGLDVAERENGSGKKIIGAERLPASERSANYDRPCSQTTQTSTALNGKLMSFKALTTIDDALIPCTAHTILYDTEVEMQVNSLGRI